jgi:pimeloyl-ACP methyl ester carboxylesterase
LPQYFYNFDERYLEPLGKCIISAQVSNWSLQQLMGWGVHAALPSIDAPTLVLVGRHDAITPLVASEILADNMPAADLVVIDDAGHFPWLEQPDAFRDAVTKWLSR